MRVVLLNGESRRIKISNIHRTFQSYVNEMCGKVGLASNTVRFQTEKRDVPPSKIVTHPCLVKMTHTYEFHQSPNKSLRPALKSIFTNQVCTDQTLIINKKQIRVNKCIVAVRSPPLAMMLKANEAAGEPDADIELECVQTAETFELMLEWIYAASVSMPDSIFEVS